MWSLTSSLQPHFSYSFTSFLLDIHLFIHLLEFINGSSCSFCLLWSSLQWGVSSRITWYYIYHCKVLGGTIASIFSRGPNSSEIWEYAWWKVPSIMLKNLPYFWKCVLVPPLPSIQYISVFITCDFFPLVNAASD